MKKGDVVDLNTLDKYYTKTRKIKFNNEIKIESLDNVYNSLFYKNYNISNEPTYYIKGLLHCESRKARSIDDFFRISKFYFPKMNVKTMITFLKFKYEEEVSKDNHMRLFFCNNIRKYNFHGLVRSNGYYVNVLTYNFKGDGFINFDSSLKDIV